MCRISIGMFLVLAGCGGNERGANEAKTAPDQVVEQPQLTELPGDLYAACRDRVEGPESPQECTATSDCTTDTRASTWTPRSFWVRRTINA